MTENAEKNEQQLKMENELLHSQIAIILSQIQPHFLYNTLAAIKEFCKTDSDMASEMIVDFANYLRGNMDSLTLNDSILFEKELHHVETYLAIEQKRFKEKLSVEYDITFRDFKLPALTLQAAVEHAVRYGITKKEGKGTVKIKTEISGGNAVISVSDDGLADEEQSPHWVERVHSRLSVMCGGTLSFTSKEGEGNTAVIIIPLKKYLYG